jgi:putative aldouronate transport system substrate-binding protein
MNEVKRLHRRKFMRFAAAGGTLMLPMLAQACAGPNLPQASTATTTISATPPATTGTTRGLGSATTPLPGQVLPTYLPGQGGPAPDYPGGGPLYEDGFDSYPLNPIKALPVEPPGAGSMVNIFTIGLFPPPTPFDQNPAWMEVNRQLKATIHFDIGYSDYLTRLSTIMAGGDLPDVMYLFTQGTSILAAAPGVPQFLRAQATDLTPYLGGDAARDYPNLAAIPSTAWQKSGSIYDGHLYTIPLHRWRPEVVWLKTSTVYDKEIGQDYVPTGSDDFKRILLQLNRPRDNFWGTGSSQDSALNLAAYSQLFGAPNNWRLDSNGALVKDWETEEYKAAAGYVRDLWAAGVFDPDSPGNNVLAQRANFARGKFAIWLDAFGNGWQDCWRQALAHDPSVNVTMLPPFSASVGGKVQHFVNGGFAGGTLLKKASVDRVKELLRILNWLAAPFGSAEDQLLSFGIKDTDYTLDQRGNPELTDRGNPDANYVPWKYVTQHPFVLYSPDLPNYARTLTRAERQLMPVAVEDPTLGLVSNTALTTGIRLNRTVLDDLRDLVLGHRPMSDYDQIIRDWRSNGGEQIRNEFLAAIAGSR